MKLVQRVQTRGAALLMIYETENAHSPLLHVEDERDGTLRAILRVYPSAFILETINVTKGEFTRLRKLAPSGRFFLSELYARG